MSKTITKCVAIYPVHGRSGNQYGSKNRARVRIAVLKDTNVALPANDERCNVIVETTPFNVTNDVARDYWVDEARKIARKRRTTVYIADGVGGKLKILK